MITEMNNCYRVGCDLNENQDPPARDDDDYYPDDEDDDEDDWDDEDDEDYGDKIWENNER